MANPKITCPSCHSTFRLPIVAIGEAGQKLRCSHCGHSWQATQNELQYEGEPAKIFVEELLKSEQPTADWLVEGAKSEQQNETQQNENAEEFAQLFVEKLVAQEIIEDDTELSKPQPALADDASDDDNNNEDNDALDKILSSIQPQQVASNAKVKAPIYTNSILLISANLMATLMLIAFCLVSWRDVIIEKVPASSAFYRVIGYAQTNNLQLGNVMFSSSKSKSGEWRYVVKGQIVNNSKKSSIVPTIRARIFDKYGDVIDEWRLAGKTEDQTTHVIPAKSEKPFSLKLPAKGDSALILAVDIGSNLELDLRK